MSNPLIQIDEEVREMTDDEYQTLIDLGWTEGTDETPIADAQPLPSAE